MIERHPSIEPVHPGEILREDILPELAMSKTAVAAALGVSRQTLYDILNEQHPVTAEMAVRFGKLFGNGAGFWANLQRSYDVAARSARWTYPGYQPWRFVDRYTRDPAKGPIGRFSGSAKAPSTSGFRGSADSGRCEQSCWLRMYAKRGCHSSP